MLKIFKKISTIIPLMVCNSAFAGFISYLDMQIDNVSDYQLYNITQTANDKGELESLNSNIVSSKQRIDIANFATNFLGQLSQDLQVDVLDSQMQFAGRCRIHIGIGSYFVKPDFTGTECRLENGDYLQLNPRYEVRDNRYKTVYKLTKSKSFSRIILFGDSMSDNGNLYQRSVELSLIFPMSPILPISPPYFNGRFTNGYVWVEKLSQQLNIPRDGLLDYAYGGASIKQDYLPVPNLDKQVAKYLTWNPSADPYALYIVWIGANDLLRHSANLSDEAITTEMLRGFERNVHLLLKHGAKHLLAPQLPDISLAPDSIAKDIENGNHTYTEHLQRLAQLYNARLKNLLMNLKQQYPDVKIMTFDVYRFLSDTRDKADEYGFKIIDKRCNPNNYWTDDLEICQKPKQYVFWDGVHPSATAHKILADLMFELVTENGFEPNVKSSLRSYQPDDFNMRNQKAIKELQKDVDSESNHGLSVAEQSRTFNIIVDNNIPLF